MLGHHSLKQVCEEVLHLHNPLTPVTAFPCCMRGNVRCDRQVAWLQVSVTMSTTGAPGLDELLWLLVLQMLQSICSDAAYDGEDALHGQRGAIKLQVTKRHLCALQRTSFFRISSAARMEMSPYMLYLQTNAMREYCC